MIKSFIALQGETIYDLCIKAYGDMRGLPYLLALNDFDEFTTRVEASALLFDEPNRNYVDFGNGVLWLDDMGNFEILVSYSNLSQTSLGLNTLIGQANTSGAGRWRIIYNSVGRLEFSIAGGGSITFNNPPISGVVKVVAVNNLVSIYVDDVIGETLLFTPTLPSTENRLLFGGYGEGAINIFDFGNSIISNASIKTPNSSKLFDFDELQGNKTYTSDLVYEGDIITSNPNGINYINSTMWITSVVKEYTGEEIYYDSSIKFKDFVSSVFIPQREFLDDYIVYENQSLYDLAVQLYGNLEEGMIQLTPLLNITGGEIPQGTILKRRVPVSNIAKQFNNNNILVATNEELEPLPLGDGFDYVFDFLFE